MNKHKNVAVPLNGEEKRISFKNISIFFPKKEEERMLARRAVTSLCRN